MPSQLKYISVWEEKYSLLLLDFLCYTFIKHTDIIGNDVKDSFVYAEKAGVAHAYYSQRDFEQIKATHGEYFLRPKNSQKILNGYETILKQQPQLLKKIQAAKFREFSNKKLAGYLKEYSAFIIKSIAYFKASRPEMEIGPARELHKLLRSYYPKSSQEGKTFNVITAATAIGPMQQELRDWLGILKNKHGFTKELRSHAQKYPFFFVGVYSWDEAVNILAKKYRQDLKKTEQLEERYHQMQSQARQLKKQQQEIFSHCRNNKQLLYLAKFFQSFGLARFRLKPVWCGMELKALDLFEEIAKRVGIATSELLETYTLKDLLAFLNQGKRLSLVEAERRRKQLVVFEVKNKQLEVLSGKEAAEFVRDALLTSEGEKILELKGTVASVGLAKGKAKIIEASSNEVLQKQAKEKSFQKGDILVTTSTQPNMVPLVKKSAAIITEVGGITSHAAVVSREFNIPCIVGIALATRTLKDNDLVEVDANKGVVKILKR